MASPSRPPPYWGVRGTYWFNSAPNWGLMIDYNHAKVIADQSAVVSVSGTRDGIPVGPKDRVGNTFRDHGVHRRPQRDVLRRPISLDP